MRRSPLVVLLTLASALYLSAADAVTPARFIVEPPTLICLGFEWYITGDDNRNAAVEVSYRKAGAERLEAGAAAAADRRREGLPPDADLDYTVPEMFAGSILDLEPDTEYECRLTHARPGWRARAKRPDRQGAHAGRTQGGRGRTRAARLPARLEGSQTAARVHRPAGGLLRLRPRATGRW